jgi:SAM-dependent methyltransferase
MGMMGRGRILNIGSAGEDYGLFPDRQVHLDVVDTFLAGKANSVVANAERIPFSDGSFEAVLCVGSVVNYCSAMEVLAEVHRVLRTGGHLILEYETTTSLEFIATPAYRKHVEVVETFYQGEKERLWAYSDRYMGDVLASLGFKERRREHIHILSALCYRFTKNETRASPLAQLDAVVSRLPWLGRHASNIILTCAKVGEGSPEPC